MHALSIRGMCALAIVAAMAAPPTPAFGLVGDSNCDTVLDCRDLDFFIAAQNDNVSAWWALHMARYGVPPTCPFLNNDATGDGHVNWQDIGPFWALLNCPDCNHNYVPDPNDIAAGTSQDCNGNGVPDECDVDPNDPDGNGLVSADATPDGIPDECQITGDVNLDFVADCNDINPFLALFGSLCAGPYDYACQNADCSGDGSVTAADLGCFITAINCTDCNGNYVDDAVDIATGTSQDCNGNGIPDECDVNPADPDGNGLVSWDCNSNGIPDECEILLGDVNLDGVADCGDTSWFVGLMNTTCQGCATGFPCWNADCNHDGVVSWQDVGCFWAATNCADCNQNGVPDPNDIAGGTSQDCNANGIPDECDLDPNDPDLNGLFSPDCNGNGVPDECDVDPNDPDGNGLVSLDANVDGIPDECQILGDVNLDFVADCRDIDRFVSLLNTTCVGPYDYDCANADCTRDGAVTWQDIACFWAAIDCPDCNGNYVPDANDIAAGTSQDCNGNGVPDECDVDPNDPDGNGLVSLDVNVDGIPDECQILGDVNLDLVADCRDIDRFVSLLNTTCVGPYDYDCANADCDHDTYVTWRDIECFWAAIDCPDCNGNYVPDANDIAAGTSQDCNGNGVPDECDVDPNDPDGNELVSRDCPPNGVPDECELPGYCRADTNCDGMVTWRDIDFFVAGMNDNVSAWWARFNPGPPTCPFANCDVNCDCHVTWRDIKPFVERMNHLCP